MAGAVHAPWPQRDNRSGEASSRTRCSGGVFDRGQEGFDGGDGLVDRDSERGSALLSYPSAGGGEQDGGEHEGDEFELVIVGGAAGAARLRSRSASGRQVVQVFFVSVGHDQHVTVILRQELSVMLAAG